MAGRQRQAQRVLEEGEAAHPGLEPLADTLEFEQQHEVELARAKAWGDLLRLVLGSVTSTPGCEARKAAIAGGTTVAPAVGKEAIRSRPPRPPAIASTSSCAASIRARIASAWEASAAPGDRRPDAAPVALDQRRPDLLLERRDRLRDGGLRVGESVGGGREGAALDDLAEGPEAARIQHQHSLSRA